MNENSESSGTSLETPTTNQPGLGLAIAALVIPVIAGILLCFVESLGARFGISGVTVVSTAALLAIDARRLSYQDLNGIQWRHASPGALFVGVLLMWFVGYPIAFFGRRKFSKPQLGYLSLAAMAFFLLAPVLKMRHFPTLPSCTSDEVVQLVEKLIRDSPAGATVWKIDGHRETRYDRTADVRYGECVMHRDLTELPIRFSVAWHDRDTWQYLVRVYQTPD